MLHFATMGKIPYVALALPMLSNQNTPTNVAFCNNGENSLCCTNSTNVAQQNHKKGNPNVATHLKGSYPLLKIVKQWIFLTRVYLRLHCAYPMTQHSFTTFNSPAY